MRVLSVGMVALFVLACHVQEMQRSDPRLARLLADREAIWQAWFTNDQQRLEQLLPSDVVAINSGDTTWQGRAAVLAAAQAFAKSGTKFVGVTFPHTEQQVYGDVAILYSRYEVQLERNGKRSVIAGRATEVFVWRDSLWQNSGWHLDSEH
ncbi:MAG TPA: nuclear transport factor 2 family protein [Gemmatimonadales bacterium]|nr:nuclear transport factor 2 family protein [Gemmatimonadales bacterium]